MSTIYILTNPAFPGYLKIICTDNVTKALNKINSSGLVPFDYKVYASYETGKSLSTKEAMEFISALIQYKYKLQIIADYNTGFIKCKSDMVYASLLEFAEISSSESKLNRHFSSTTNIAPSTKNTSASEPPTKEPTSHNAMKGVVKKKKKGPFNFHDVEIPVGSVITYIYDEQITAIVVDDRHISYKGEITTLSALQQKLAGIDYLNRGPKFFKYNGEILNDRRTRYESIAESNVSKDIEAYRSARK